MTVGKSNQRLALVVVVGAVFMTNLDLWIVNVALPAIGQGFGRADLANLSWVLNGYAVGLAALLIVAGRLGDRIGHRQVFLAGVAVFTIASALCAIAPNLGVLVAARVVQSAGAAAQLPTSLALLLASVRPEKRTAAARGWSAVGGLAAATGPVAGGLLVAWDWRWVFVVNLPIGVASLIAGWIALPGRTRPADHVLEPMPDLIGAGLVTVAVGALTGGLVEAPDWGWDSPSIIGLFALAVVAGLAFWQRCRTHERPLFELHLLRVRGFGLANAATFVFSVAFSIMLLSNVLWCQEVWHYSALRTGLAMVPGPALVPIVTVLSARAVHRFGSGRVAAVGALFFAAAMLWRVGNVSVAPDYVHDLLPSMLLGGIGVGLGLGTMIAAGVTSLPGHRSATGSAMVNAGRQIAAAVGVAILVSLLEQRVDGTTGFRWAWTIAAGLAVVSGVLAMALPAPRAAAVLDERSREERDGPSEPVLTMD